MGRGCRGQPIFANLEDCEHFTYVLDDVAELFGWSILDWVLMPNHHHLVVQLSEVNLAAGMHRLHFMFGQRWNERNDSTGHVLFRRFMNIPLRREGSAARVMRYIDLNPVRAGLCAEPEDWLWGGYLATVGRCRPYAFHAPDLALRAAEPHHVEPGPARLAYARAVRARLEQTRGRGNAEDWRPSLDEIVVADDVETFRDAVDIWRYSQREIAEHLGRSQASVSRMIISG